MTSHNGVATYNQVYVYPHVLLGLSSMHPQFCGSSSRRLPVLMTHSKKVFDAVKIKLFLLLNAVRIRSICCAVMISEVIMKEKISCIVEIDLDLC